MNWLHIASLRSPRTVFGPMKLQTILETAKSIFFVTREHKDELHKDVWQGTFKRETKRWRGTGRERKKNEEEAEEEEAFQIFVIDTDVEEQALALFHSFSPAPLTIKEHSILQASIFRTST